MQRFLIFPPLFVIWFVAAQLELAVLSRLGAWLAFRGASSTTDVYLIIAPVRATFFLPAVLAGAIVGCVFAALDFALHRDEKKVEQRARYLALNLLKSGAIGLALILICYAALLGVVVQQGHRRYHAYPPDIQFLSTLHYVQALPLLLCAVWAMAKTLMRRSD